MKNIFILTLLVFTLPLVAQKKKKGAEVAPKETKAYKTQQGVLKKALQYADYEVAKNALYQMMVLDTANSSLKDTLCMVYFQAGQYAQCIVLSKEILENDASKVQLRELKAIAEKSLGYFKEALKDYELLYENEPKVDFLYQICTIQYEMRRYGECLVNADKIIAHPKSSEISINIMVRNAQQEVPMNAAAMNIKGVVYIDMNDAEKAEVNFKKALAIAPEFQLAKNNLASLTEKDK